MRIAVAGATGLLGRHLVDIAAARGHETVPLSRRTGIDLAADPPPTPVLAGVDVVVDALSVGTLRGDDAVAFFERTTRALLAAEAAAGVRHHLAVSIVGVDRAPFGYYAGKAAQERAVESGSVPWTILRATQFHEFADQMYDRLGVGPFHVAPRMRTQPIAVAEVAQRLVELAETPAQGRARDLAGPAEESLVAMVRAVARARGNRLPVAAVSLPGDFGRAQRAGTLLPGPDADRGRTTFAEWIAARA